MKESGIDWIGQIPEEWEVVRLQDVGDYKKGPFGSAITIDMFIEKSPGSYKVYEQKNAIRGNCEIGEAYIPKNVYNNLKNFSVYPLDIIVSCAGTIGKCYILPEDCEQGIINQALMRVRVNKSVNLEYFLYIFDIVLSYAAIKYSNGSAIKNIPPFNVLNKLRVTLPSNIEQLQIVNYLDKKISMLDKAKALLEEQIQKLKDYRASLIYETVTKGLDKTVPLKDSGIDWIGQVPEGWGVSKLEQYVDIFGRIGFRGYTTNDIVNEGEGAISYSPSNIIDYSVIDNNNTYISWSKYDESPEIQIKTGDVLYVKTGSSYGKAGIVNKLSNKATINPQLVVLKPKKNTDSRLINYFLNSSVGKEQSELIVGGSTIPTITQESIKKMIFPKMSFEEQQKIVDFLDKKTVQIDQLIQIKNKQIGNINKQRQTLIYDYVTGKRRV